MSPPLVSTPNVPAYILHTQPFDSKAWGCWDRWLMRYTHLNEDALLNASDVTPTLPVTCYCLSAGSRRGSSYFPTEFLTLSSPLLLFASWSSRRKKWKAVIHTCQIWFLRRALIVVFKLPAPHAHINLHVVHCCLLSACLFERDGKRAYPAGTHIDSRRTFNQQKTQCTTWIQTVGALNMGLHRIFCTQRRSGVREAQEEAATIYWHFMTTWQSGESKREMMIR